MEDFGNVDGWVNLFWVSIFQIVFVFLRAKNIQNIAKNDILRSNVTGAVMSLVWLISTALGVKSILSTLDKFTLYDSVVIIVYVLSGVLGQYIAMKRKIINK